MVGIVVVSHSPELASGLSVLAGQMAGPGVAITWSGGTDDGGLGTDAEAVSAAIDRASRDGDGVVVLGDLGSSILTVRSLLDGDDDGRVRLADAPIVEGAVSAAVTASTGADLQTVLKAAEEARDARKL